MKLKIGDKVPEFELKNQHNETFNSFSVIGTQPVVLYFYPKNDTPGCTKEACKFRDEFEVFTDMGVQVIGVSSDDVASHKAFAEKYNLPFTLLADVDKRLRKMFGVPTNFMGLIPGRVTYIINKDGVITDIFDHQMNAEKHIEEAIESLRKK
ncbi:peroxiredoxin [Flavobacteriaceae bacterium F08102]|nr:peroxiredoxin [Flavobacteriaceae bacterium F08102]